MSVIANVFSILQAVNSFLTTLPKKSRFRTGFDIQDVKPSDIFWKTPLEDIYHLFRHSH